MPALLMRMSSRSHSWRTMSARRRTSESEEKSAGRHRRRLRRLHRPRRLVGQRAAAADERSAKVADAECKVARRSTLSHSKQRAMLFGGYTYRPAARIVWPVPRPLASSVVLGHYLTDVAPHKEFSALIRRISARSSASIFGRPPRERDFHRQYRRKPARCQRTRVLGRMIVMALKPSIQHDPHS